MMGKRIDLTGQAKRCRECGEVKDIDEFWKNREICKICCKKIICSSRDDKINKEMLSDYYNKITKRIDKEYPKELAELKKIQLIQKKYINSCNNDRLVAIKSTSQWLQEMNELKKLTHIFNELANNLIKAGKFDGSRFILE